MTEPHIIPSYTERLEAMLAESNIRLAASTEMIVNTRDITPNEANRLIDTYVDDWHYLNQERGEFPGVAVPKWVAERWAKSDAMVVAKAEQSYTCGGCRQEMIGNDAKSWGVNYTDYILCPDCYNNVKAGQ